MSRFVREHDVGYDVVGHLWRGHQVHLGQAASLRTSSRKDVLHDDVDCAACRRRLCCMKTSVVLHEDVGDHVERRPGTQRGGNRAYEERRKRRHPRRKERRDAQGSAKGMAAWRKSGTDARAAWRKQGGGRALAPRRRRVQCKLQRAARVDAHDVGEQEAPVGGVVDQ